MQPLYETYSIWSLEEYSKFNYVVTEKQLKKLRKTVYIVAASMLVLGVLMIAVPFFSTSLGIDFLIASVLYLCFSLLKGNGNMDKSIKAAWESDKGVQGAVFHISFFEDRLVSEGSFGSEIVQYANIFKIIEDDTNFYIMLSKIRGINIIKANCSEELINYIRGIAGRGIEMEVH